MINVVLMAGSGKRFTDAGYTQNKALIPVSGKPMIVRAVECMPPADKWVFVVRQEHIDEKEVIDTLKSVAKNVTVIVDPNPVGQLKSALVAKQFYDNYEPLFIGACDFGMTYDLPKYEKFMDPSGSKMPDMVSWSFSKQPNLVRNPQAWGWLRVDDEYNINGVSVKIPISDDPYNDFAITGSFSFRHGKLFLRLAEELMRRDIRVKGEFYIDSMLGLACELGYSVKHFPTDKYIGWGVPADYEEYLYWEKAIAHPAQHPEAKEKNEYNFWHEYFTKHFKH